MHMAINIHITEFMNIDLCFCSLQLLASMNDIFTRFNPCTLVLLCIAFSMKCKYPSQLYLDVCYDVKHEK